MTTPPILDPRSPEGPILAILLDRLSDTLLATPLLWELRGRCPRLALDLLTLTEHEPLLRGLPGVRSFYTLPAGQAVALEQELRQDPLCDSYPGPQRLLQRLDLPSYGFVLNLTHSRLSAWLATAIPAERWDGGMLNAAGEWLYSGDRYAYRVALLDFQPQNHLHVADLYRAALPCDPPTEAVTRPFCSLTLPAAPSSGPPLILLDGPDDLPQGLPGGLVESGLRSMGARPQAPGVSAAAAPLDFARRCAAAALVITRDVGAAQLAAAVGTPVLALYGSTELMPYGEGHVLLQAPRGLPVELLLLTARYCLGMADEGPLREALQRADVAGYRSAFLPPDADELGGLWLRPLHGLVMGAAELFARVQRHVFAWDFLGRRGALGVAAEATLLCCPGVSLAEELQGAAVLPGFEEVRAVAGQLSALAAVAGDARGLLHQGRPCAALTEHLREGIDMLRRLEERPLLRPALTYLHWRLRFLPPLPLAEVLLLHQAELCRSRDLLLRSLDLCAGLLRELQLA